MAFEIVQQPDLFRLRLFGTLTEQDLVDIAAAADTMERGRDYVPARIADMTGVTRVEIDYEMVKALANRRRVIQFPNAFRSAIVVSTPVQMGMARMYQTLMENPQITLEIFDNEAAALAWLGRPASGHTQTA